ncbi:YeeE/YedE family protein [Enterovibrio paralichthyis]|uniref:YeeE/YedE family protein n=1 Tax=Enterovibrio paralichthyis TaxID=2853805 RepID=UPI001C4777CC|nr:YeeE/YedE thiosulfate transporter family protein [Enterovibrio paralichthyis]MBV7297341.1 YeeE/YedE family protein [Enterovibrio paralichthyis]
MTFQIPWDALFGGMLLGVSGLVLLALNGRIAGISGIIGGLLKPSKGEFSWRLLFLAGMVAAGFTATAMGFAFPDFAALDPAVTPLSAVAAGLLVGMGTKLANGCTSGHGICGMGRLSKRSIAATLTFMAAAVVTVFIRFHV